MFAADAGAGPVDFDSFLHRFANNLLRCFLPVFFLIASVTTVKAQDAKAKCPPAARVEDVTETMHGVVVHDPYRWLEDQNSSETRAWIDAENACTQAVLSKLPGQEAIAKRLGELIKVIRSVCRRSAADDIFTRSARRIRI